MIADEPTNMSKASQFIGQDVLRSNSRPFGSFKSRDGRQQIAWACRRRYHQHKSETNPLAQKEVGMSFNNPRIKEQTTLQKATTVPSSSARSFIETKLLNGAIPRATPKIDISALLSKPSWSVQTLLPDPSIPIKEEVTHQQLQHLLRLSALAVPSSAAEEKEMLSTLHTQLHFVRAMQEVNTEGVEPLCSLKDETEEGIKDVTIGLDTPEIREALGNEDVVGRVRRPRRRRDVEVDTKGAEDWDVFPTAERTVQHAGGRYFVVGRGKR